MEICGDKKKSFAAVFICLLFCMAGSGCSAQSQIPEADTVQYYIVEEANLYINDELQQVVVYWNDNFYQSETKEYVPLQACMEALGCTFERKSPANIIIRTPDNREIDMLVGDTTISYTGGIRDVARVPWEYIEVDGVIYYPLYEFPELVDCEIFFEGKDIHLDSGEYIKNNDAGDEIVGQKVDIDVYVNDKKVEALVYTNLTMPPVQGLNNLCDYVQLEPIIEALGIGLPETAEWDFMFDPVIIDGEIYVDFSAIRYNIDGSLRQDDDSSMYLYSADYERLDIPANLEEAYKALDGLLDPEDVDYIRNLPEDELIELHFGLGTWIRNNWLYPANSRLSEFFYSAGLNDPDGMSGVILLGYHRYLNGEEYVLDIGDRP